MYLQLIMIIGSCNSPFFNKLFSIKLLNFLNFKKFYLSIFPFTLSFLIQFLGKGFFFFSARTEYLALAPGRKVYFHLDTSLSSKFQNFNLNVLLITDKLHTQTVVVIAFRT